MDFEPGLIAKALGKNETSHPKKIIFTKFLFNDLSKFSIKELTFPYAYSKKLGE